MAARPKLTVGTIKAAYRKLKVKPIRQNWQEWTEWNEGKTKPGKGALVAACPLSALYYASLKRMPRTSTLGCQMPRRINKLYGLSDNFIDTFIDVWDSSGEGHAVGVPKERFDPAAAKLARQLLGSNITEYLV